MANLKFALLVILILAFYYQPIAGRCPSCPNVCCYVLRKGKPMQLSKISFYRRTSSGCRYNAVVLWMKNGRKVCVNADERWVKNVMTKLPEN